MGEFHIGMWMSTKTHMDGAVSSFNTLYFATGIFGLIKKLAKLKEKLALNQP
jgi:hypothetical protein